MSKLGYVARGVAGAVVVYLICALVPFSVGGQEEKPDLVWYGYVKLDASWDEGVVNAGNFARWVLSPESADPHAHFNMTARQTRLGFRVQSSSGDAKITGRWESDFYGGGAENKNSLQVRHAYVEVAWPSGWTILAGQTSDVISPRVPNTLNYTVAWWAGNIGYRRPQLRVRRRVDLGRVDLTITGAAARTIGDDFGVPEPGDTGTDSGLPTAQGHAALSWTMGSGTASLGLHGHAGRENLRHELGDEIIELSASGWGGDMTLPLGSLTLSGEFWTGWNLDDYFGGIGQGIAVSGTVAQSVASTGGWGEMAWRDGPTRFHAGFGLDDPDDADLMAGSRARNLALWSNVQRDFGGSLSAGVEVSRWETRYVGMEEGSSMRVQTSVIYSF
jgi:hypothetical protein